MSFSPEAITRIVASAVEYLDRHQDATVTDALRFAMLLELCVYGAVSKKAE